MNKKTKIRVLRYFAFIIIFLMIWTIFHFTFENLNEGYKAMICGGLTVILAPRINEYETQTGKHMQLKWIFMKKPISI